MRQTYVCRRPRLCRYLMNCGFAPYQTTADRNNPRYTVWLFEHTPGLAAAVLDYFSSRKEERN